MTKLLSYTLAALCLLGCNRSSKQADPENDPIPSPRAERKAEKQTPAPEPKRDPVALIMEKKTIPEAFSFANPRDVQDDKDPGTALFAIWLLNQSFKIKDLKPTTPETSIAKIMKDSDAERGKKLCTSGTIVEIATDKSAGKPIYYGGLMNDSVQVIRFVAVGSSGELVQQSSARFCGVVMGLDSYGNAGGGTTHAVSVVGMFDLPENK